MARMIPGSIVSDVRGKLGGSVFQRSAGGLTIRSKASPVNPRTASQSVARSRLFALQQAWQQLTAEQRKAWNAWVLFQNIRTAGLSSSQLKGQAAFIQANAYRRIWSEADIEDPVFTPHTLVPTGISFASAGGSLIFTVDGALTAADYYPIVYSTPQQSAARNSPVVPPRLIVPGLNVNDNDWNLTSGWTPTWGPIPTSGAFLFVTWGLIQVDNGTLSAFVSQPIEVG